jgi:hypothetical protein
MIATRMGGSDVADAGEEVIRRKLSQVGVSRDGAGTQRRAVVAHADHAFDAVEQ